MICKSILCEGSADARAVSEIGKEAKHLTSIVIEKKIKRLTKNKKIFVKDSLYLISEKIHLKETDLCLLLNIVETRLFNHSYKLFSQYFYLVS